MHLRPVNRGQTCHIGVAVQQAHHTLEFAVGTVAGWVHFLAFDLFVGTWIAERSAQLGLSHGGVVPLLLMTFMLGPLGLLAFVLMRALRRPAALKWQPGAIP